MKPKTAALTTKTTMKNYVRKYEKQEMKYSNVILLTKNIYGNHRCDRDGTVFQTEEDKTIEREFEDPFRRQGSFHKNIGAIQMSPFCTSFFQQG